MTTGIEEINRNKNEQSQPPFDPALPLGATAVQGESISISRMIKFAGQDCTTNLPEGLMPFDVDDSDYPGAFYFVPLLPNTLDELALGDYVIVAPEQRQDRKLFESDEEYEKEGIDQPTRELRISEGPKGKVFNIDALGEKDNEYHDTEGNVRSKVYKILEDLGCVIALDADEWFITDLPTPETVQQAAQLLGIDVQLFPEVGKIPGEPYLRAHEAGGHPVSTENQEEYMHDTIDSHLIIRVLGGELLSDELAACSGIALAEHIAEPDVVDEVALNIDSLTENLYSLALGDHEGGLDIELEQFRGSADILGITSERQHEIMVEVAKNASERGVVVRKIFLDLLEREAQQLAS